MNKAPCKDCADRHLACHDNCPKYRAFIDEKRRVAEIKRKAHHEEEYEIKKHARLRKIHNNKKF